MTTPPDVPARTAPAWGVHLIDGALTASLWAPDTRAVALAPEQAPAVPLASTSDGWHASIVPGAVPGGRYRFEVDGVPVPDPAARAQPDGVDGPSAFDHPVYEWRCPDWTGRPWTEAVLYELHIGTFTAAGTYDAAIARLDHLAALGVTVVELMPVASFAGRHGWGYDGVLLFAPHHAYGTPDDLRRLVDECHLRGMSIILDVVYNHFGPHGDWLHHYAPGFFTDRHPTPWGAGINFDGPLSEAVRAFFVQNALHWLRDFRFDGLRLDAVQAIMDDSPVHILQELAQSVRAALPGRHVLLTLENDNNDARWTVPGSGNAHLYDGQWNDDFHHAMRVLVTGQSDGYYEDYADEPARRLGQALAEGFTYQGEASVHRGGELRGTPSGHLPPWAFINFIQNHDQVGNSAFGMRLTGLAPADAVQLATAVTLLAPAVPMLFMGQEWGSARPFNYFCDHAEPLATMVRDGRRNEFKRFKDFQSDEACAAIADPGAPSTRDGSVLDWDALDQPGHAAWLALHKGLLQVRLRVVMPLLHRIGGNAGSWRVLSPTAVAVTWQMDGQALVLAANFSDEPLNCDLPTDAAYVLGERDGAGLAPWGMVLAVVPGQ